MGVARSSFYAEPLGRPADAVIVAEIRDITFSVDSIPVDWSGTWAHRGIMFSSMPNLAWVMGYLRSSWTLRADMISEFVCRLLERKDASGNVVVTPRLRASDANMPALPFIDP
ncbi:hypothetical protein [Meridianimarinicoccus sp. MJW13]|uniref:hypothetical protein n=1 Tax=Meridianimarinicoccus sp. MJW13 TaxID=2720031 RepID=UPI0018670D44|nr:hypothetical protein [Fluviibacterium sp. MJW13]